MRLTATVGDDSAVRRLRAGPLGGFTVRLPDLAYDRCSDALVVVARGARGSTATLKRMPLPPCPPA